LPAPKRWRRPPSRENPGRPPVMADSLPAPRAPAPAPSPSTRPAAPAPFPAPRKPRPGARTRPAPSTRAPGRPHHPFPAPPHTRPGARPPPFSPAPTRPRFPGCPAPVLAGARQPARRRSARRRFGAFPGRPPPGAAPGQPWPSPPGQASPGLPSLSSRPVPPPPWVFARGGGVFLSPTPNQIVLHFQRRPALAANQSCQPSLSRPSHAPGPGGQPPSRPRWRSSSLGVNERGSPVPGPRQAKPADEPPFAEPATSRGNGRSGPRPGPREWGGVRQPAPIQPAQFYASGQLGRAQAGVRTTDLGRVDFSTTPAAIDVPRPARPERPPRGRSRRPASGVDRLARTCRPLVRRRPKLCNDHGMWTPAAAITSKTHPRCQPSPARARSFDHPRARPSRLGSATSDPHLGVDACAQTPPAAGPSPLTLVTGRPAVVRFGGLIRRAPGPGSTAADAFPPMSCLSSVRPAPRCPILLSICPRESEPPGAVRRRVRVAVETTPHYQLPLGAAAGRPAEAGPTPATFPGRRAPVRW